MTRFFSRTCDVRSKQWKVLQNYCLLLFAWKWRTQFIFRGTVACGVVQLLLVDVSGKCDVCRLWIQLEYGWRSIVSIRGNWWIYVSGGSLFCFASLKAVFINRKDCSYVFCCIHFEVLSLDKWAEPFADVWTYARANFNLPLWINGRNFDGWMRFSTLLVFGLKPQKC